MAPCIVDEFGAVGIEVLSNFELVCGALCGSVPPECLLRITTLENDASFWVKPHAVFPIRKKRLSCCEPTGTAPRSHHLEPLAWRFGARRPAASVGLPEPVISVPNAQEPREERAVETATASSAQAETLVTEYNKDRCDNRPNAAKQIGEQGNMEELEKKDVDNTIQCGMYGERHSPGAIYCICGRVLPATWTKKEQARGSGQVTNQCVRRKVCEETIFNCRHEDVNTTRTPGVRGSALFVALYACRRKGKFAVLLTTKATPAHL